MSTSTIRLQLGETELHQAHKLAKEWGFSSVEEALREFIKRFLSKSGTISSQKIEYITLTKKAQLRYKQMAKDSDENKNIHVARSVDEFLAQLNA